MDWERAFISGGSSTSTQSMCTDWTYLATSGSRSVRTSMSWMLRFRHTSWTLALSLPGDAVIPSTRPSYSR